MQDYFRSSSHFSQRTDELARHLGCLLGDLPKKIGVSERSFYGYRSGKYPITAKALRKLEAFEHSEGMAAARLPATLSTPEIAVREGNPKDFAADEPAEIRRRLDEMHAQIQAAITAAPFTLQELERRMRDAGAWPASEQDGKLPPGQLWTKYAPK